MSVILTGYVWESGHSEVLCPCCRRSVGVFDEDEVRGMSRCGIVPVCFDCDGLDADKVSPVLRMDETEYAISIDGVPFSASWDPFEGVHRWSRFTGVTWHTVVRIWGISPLSSCTYLNAGKGDE
jgi:hypothetical protein